MIQIYEADQLRKMITSNKELISATFQHNLDQEKIILYDIQLKKRGDQEDIIYASNQDFYTNIRRGLTVLQYNDKNIILRKGLIKFFYIDVDHLLNIKKKMSKLEKTLYNYTLNNVLQLLQSKPISIIRMEKLNGENAQITYFQPLDAWSISSKNVTILCRNEDDINLYNGKRYTFAILIAKEWFKILTDQIIKQKQPISEITLIGEYCGNQEYQHLVKYNQVQLNFFAVVGTQDKNTCLYPKKSLQFLQELGLQIVNYSEQIINNEQELKTYLQTLKKEIAVKKVEEEGEGCVLYFCDPQEEVCLSLGKLKTLEYVFYRKLREKLKLHIEKKGDIEQQIAEYQTELINLGAGYDIDILQFVNFAKKCYYKIEEHDNKFRNILHNKFIDFIDWVNREDIPKI